MSCILFRTYSPEDAESLALVYRDAVRGIGPIVYSTEQIEAWSMYPDDLEEFRDRLSQGLTLLALEKHQPVAFGQLSPLNHLAFLYCSTSHCRKGIERGRGMLE